MKKIIEVPEEIQNMFLFIKSYTKLRDVYVHIPFGFKKASRASFIMEKSRQQAWKMARAIYPEIIDKNVAYIYDRNTIEWDEE